MKAAVFMVKLHNLPASLLSGGKASPLQPGELITWLPGQQESVQAGTDWLWLQAAPHSLLGRLIKSTCELCCLSNSMKSSCFIAAFYPFIWWGSTCLWPNSGRHRFSSSFEHRFGWRGASAEPKIHNGPRTIMETWKELFILECFVGTPTFTFSHSTSRASHNFTYSKAPQHVKPTRTNIWHIGCQMSVGCLRLSSWFRLCLHVNTYAGSMISYRSSETPSALTLFTVFKVNLSVCL